MWGQYILPIAYNKLNISVKPGSNRRAVKDLFRRGTSLAIESGLHIFLAIFGLGIFSATLIDKTFPPQQVMVWQVLGLTIFTNGFTRLIDLWWGMDSSKKILEELGKQQAEIQATRAEITRLNNMLEQHFKQPAIEPPQEIESVYQNGHQLHNES